MVRATRMTRWMARPLRWRRSAAISSRSRAAAGRATSRRTAVPPQGAVQRTMWPASPLAGAGLQHALPHDGTRFPRLRGGQQLPGRLAGNTDLEVDSVADGPRNPIAVARPREW